MTIAHFFLILIGLIGLMLVMALISGITEGNKVKQLQRYWDIKIGMPETEMLSIMGDGYSRSLLKNDRVKYEWRIKATSQGYSHNGISSRTYSGVKKVSIYTQNGVVEEVKPYNV